MDEAETDPSQDQESLGGLLLDTSGTLTVDGPGNPAQRYTPITLVHFSAWIVCLHSHCLSSLASKQTHSFTDSQLFCQVQMNLNEADYPRKCTQVRLRQPEHLQRERALSLKWGEKPIQMESRIKDDLIPLLIITIKREEQHLSLTVL